MRIFNIWIHFYGAPIDTWLDFGTKLFLGALFSEAIVFLVDPYY